MLSSAADLEVNFHCRVKTHKTVEETELELDYGLDGVSKTTFRIVVSTLTET